MEGQELENNALSQRKRFSKDMREKIVLHLVNGERLIEEVMELYQISSRRTIVRWLKEYLHNQKRS